MSRTFISSSLLAALACLSVHTTQAQTDSPLSPAQIARIDSTVSEVMAEDGVTGVQVAVGIGDEVVWTGGYGMADLENFVPVTSQTRFRTASISKWLTATAAMCLVEQGKLDLDAPIQVYCPQFPEKEWTITTRHLLMHRAGIRHYHGSNDEPRETPEQRQALEQKRNEERLGQIIRYTDVNSPLDRFSNDPLLFEPGTRFDYSSHGFRLVGSILGGAAGTSYNALMRDLVFDPARMSLTRDDDAHAIIPGRARGYTRTDDGDLRRSRFRDVSENIPGGGHVSTAADLVRFALAFHNDRLVSPESREQMTAAPSGSEDQSQYYGFGVNVERLAELDGKAVLRHGGSQDETRTHLILLPSNRIAVAVMSNYERISTSPLAHAICRAVLGIEDLDLPVDDKQLASIEGAYEPDDGEDPFEVTIRDGRVTGRSSRREHAMKHQGDLRFLSRFNGDARYLFTFHEEDGRVNELTIENSAGQRTRLQRITPTDTEPDRSTDDSGDGRTECGVSPVQFDDDAPRNWRGLYEPHVHGEMPYRLMKPLDFDSDTRYRLIVSLHGGGGRGTDNQSQLKDWNRQLAEPQTRADHPCYVLAPQSDRLWDAVHLERIKEIVAALPSVDRDRIYILGHSMGGHGTYILIQLDPDYFAAAAPSAGSGRRQDEEFIDASLIKDVPIWAFHGDQDRVCPIERDQKLLLEMQELGGNMKLTTWVDDGHAVSGKFIPGADNGNTRLSSDRCDEEPDFLKWLFAQERTP